MTPDYSKLIPSMPKETARAANAIFGRSNFYIVIGDYLELLLGNIQLQDLLEKEDASRVEWDVRALITFFQFIEGLTDAQAVDAVRTRVDWKFALHFSLSPAPFYEHALCEFRQRILREPVSQQEFQRLVDQLITFVPSLEKNFHALKSLEVVASVCSVNRLNHAQQAMNQTLEILAVRFPDWLRKNALPHWYGRYNHATPRLELAILLGQQRFLIEEIGTDIYRLLEKIHRSDSCELKELHEVNVLNQVWSQQFKAPNLAPNSWPENLNLKDCNTCAYRGAGRRR
jgi:transposase